VWFIPNLGSVTVLLIFYPILLILYPLTKKLSKKIASCHKNKRAIRGQLFYQMPLGFVKGNYIVLVICAFLNLLYGTWGNGTSTFNQTIACITLIFLAVFPISIQKFLLNRRADLKKQSFRRQFSVAYEDLIEKDKKFFAYPLVFYYRRLILPFVILYFNK